LQCNDSNNRCSAVAGGAAAHSINAAARPTGSRAERIVMTVITNITRRPCMRRPPYHGTCFCGAVLVGEFPFRPGVHVNYQETVLHIHDGLPKLKDLPKAMGGSEIALPE
jgi:hypothetical protein